MGRPSKFTAEARERILQAKKVGAADRTAAHVAGIGPSTLKDWLRRGQDAPAGSQYRAFWEAFQEAAAHPRERALGIIYNAMPDRPDLAWKFIERREDGYAPPVAAPAAVAVAPVNVTLSFFEATPQSQVSAGEVIDVEPGTDSARVAELPSRASSGSA